MEIKHRGGEETEDSYKGIPIHAIRGCHQKILDLVHEHAGKNGLTLDLGAGQGALSLRLHDAGHDVRAYDLSDEAWAAQEVKCTVCDFVPGFSSEIKEDKPIRAICVVEVIEHLENPREFIREVSELAKRENACIIMTTPNPLDTFSCLSLFTRGIFNWFSPQHYTGGGHISILPYWMLEEHFRYCGMANFSWVFIGPFEHPSKLKSFVYRSIVAVRRRLLRCEFKDFVDGQTAIVVVKP